MTDEIAIELNTAEKPKPTRLRMFLRSAAYLWVGNLVLILLAIAWLQIPDAHLWQFLCSMVAAIAIAAGFIGLYRHVFIQLIGTDKKAPFWLGAVALVVAVLLGLAAIQLVDLLRGKEADLASLANSKLPAQWRNFFSFERVMNWGDDLCDLLEYAFFALLLPMTMQLMTSGAGKADWKRALSVLRRWRYWAVAILAAFLGSWVGGKLMGWTPGHTVRAEIVSVIARLGVAYTFAMALLCAVLALTARYLAHPELVEKLRWPWPRKRR